MAKMQLETPKNMTDQMMLETWSQLLRPHFTQDAEFSFKPRKRTLSVTWALETDPSVRKSLAIVFTNLAWKAYRGARSARRSRADQHLEALVRLHLSQVDPLQDARYDSRSSELELSVASVDLFPPPSGAQASAALGQFRAG